MRTSLNLNIKNMSPRNETDRYRKAVLSIETELKEEDDEDFTERAEEGMNITAVRVSNLTVKAEGPSAAFSVSAQ